VRSEPADPLTAEMTTETDGLRDAGAMVRLERRRNVSASRS
jgi:hypothetical protein